MRLAPWLAVLGATACGRDFQPEPPTWYHDVAPILSQHCMMCHHDGAIAPFALTDPARTRQYARDMLAQIEAGTMPPFYARYRDDCAPRFAWRDDPRLTTGEVETLHRWVDTGMLEGEPSPVLPPPRTDLSGVTSTLVPVEPFAASGDRDQFICYLLDPAVTGSMQWLTGLQVRPGIPEVVHHVVVSELVPSADLDSLVQQYGVGHPWNCGAPGIPTNLMLTIWTPGNDPVQMPAGMGIPLYPGAKIVLQIHYHPAGEPYPPDATAVDLRVGSDWPQRMYFAVQIGNAPSAPYLLPDPDDRDPNVPEFRIPADSPDHGEHMRIPIRDLGGLSDVRVVSVNPHMHLLGTRIAAWIDRAMPAAGEPARECLAEADWNFDWQRTYRYDAPVDRLPTLAVGDTVDIQCHWNNTLANPFEQRALADQGLVAPIDVGLGNSQSTDEMCLEILGLSAPAPPP